MLRSVRRAACLAWLVTAVVLAVSAASASADATVPFNNWTVSGSLTLAKLHQAATLPSGATFNGSADLTTGTLTGNVSIPQFTTRLYVLGLPVDATLQFVQAAPVSGTLTINGSNATVTATASEYVHLTRLSSPLLPLNLVGNGCQTSAPVSLPLSTTGNVFTLIGQGFTATGSTTIPPLENCGLATPLLNWLMAGPNNPFSITLAP
jgi:hypothetical protein